MSKRKTSLITRLTRDGMGSLTFDIVIYLIMTFILLITLYPFLNTLAISFNDALDSLAGGVTIMPRVFTTFNYETIFKDSSIIRATYISVLRTAIGAGVNMISCMMVAYGLSRREYVLRLFVTRIFIFTMYFSGGLIPYYLLMRSVGLIGTFWIYIVPSIVSAWNIMVMRSFIESGVPESLIESAKIDGSSEFVILFKIVFPLSLPVIATVLLWNAVGQWNSWFDVSIYNASKPELSTLQFELRKVLQQITMTTSSDNAAQQGASMASRRNTTTPQAVRAAMTIVATFPILCVYPFLQRYFIHGLTLGGVKG